MSLGKQGIRAVKWSAIATVARFVMQFAAQIILARILGPENYGIFGIGLVVLTLTNVFSNFGFGWSLLHRKVVTEEDVRFAFTWQVIVGSTATLVLFLLAPVLAEFFHEPRVEPVIRWLSLACVISAVSSPAGNLMHRDLNFKAAGLIQIGGYVAGYLLVGVPMALLGYGVDSLVAAWLVQVSFISVGSFIAHPHSYRPLFRYEGGGVAMRTGGTVFFTNVVNWCLGSMDRFLLSKLANAHAVGVYSVGANLATMPATLLVSSLQPAFTAAGSKMQDDPSRMRNVYLQIFSTVWVLLLPVFVALSISAFDIVKLLYGDKWIDTGWVLAIMFLSVPSVVCLGLSTPVLWNFGRKKHESMLQLPILALGAVGFYYSIPYGVNAFALMAAVLVTIRAALVCFSVFHLLKVGFAPVGSALLRGILLSIVAGLCAWLGGYGLSSFGSAGARVMGSGLLSMTVLALVVYLKPDIIGIHAIAMITRFSPKLGNKLTGKVLAQP